MKNPWWRETTEKMEVYTRETATASGPRRQDPRSETIISSPELFKFAARVHFMPWLLFLMTQFYVLRAGRLTCVAMLPCLALLAVSAAPTRSACLLGLWSSELSVGAVAGCLRVLYG